MVQVEKFDMLHHFIRVQHLYLDLSRRCGMDGYLLLVRARLAAPSTQFWLLCSILSLSSFGLGHETVLASSPFSL
jgi:hypothetical protein